MKPEDLPTLEDVRRERAKRDVAYFIENFCYIENPDVPERAQLFKLWPKQKEALRIIERNRLVIILKARQMGLSWLSLSFAHHQLLFKPGYTVVVISKSENEAKELVRRLVFQLDRLPPYLARPYSPKAPFPIAWESTVLSVQFYHDGQKTSRFMAMAASQNAGRSFTADLVLLDEWAHQQWAHEIWTAAYPVINRPNGGKVIGISTGLRGTLFEEMWEAAQSGENGFYPLFLSWRADPSRDDNWYEQTKRNMPLTYRQEYPSTPEDAFSAGGGKFFSEFDPFIHVVEPFAIPEHWIRYRTLDYGLDMLAAYWIAIDPQGTAYVYREVHEPNLIISEAAKKILMATKPSERIRMTYAPPDLWNSRQDTGKSAAEIFQANGILLTRSSAHRKNGWKAVKEWLHPFDTRDEQTGEAKKTAKLKIFSNCTNLIRCLSQLRCDELDPEDAATDPHEVTHAPDALRYFCVMRIQTTKEKKAEPEGFYLGTELEDLGIQTKRIWRAM